MQFKGCIRPNGLRNFKYDGTPMVVIAIAVFIFFVEEENTFCGFCASCLLFYSIRFARKLPKKLLDFFIEFPGFICIWSCINLDLFALSFSLVLLERLRFRFEGWQIFLQNDHNCLS